MKISEKLCAVLEDYDFTVHRDYSGKFMFGRTCFGISGSGNVLTQFYIAIHDLSFDDEFEEEVSVFWNREIEPCSDSLGLDTIWYFPQVQVE